LNESPKNLTVGRRISAGGFVAASIWLAAVVSAMVVMSRESNTPSSATTPPPEWPAETSLAAGSGHPTLIMFAHPRCPCTRASLGELELLLAHFRGDLTTHVVFIKPPGTAHDWANSDLWRKASAIPGVNVHRDAGGVEARRFNCEASGHTALYGADGRLLFQGGITISRGHAGDNPGRDAILNILRRKRANEVTTAVFGCLLEDPRCRAGRLEP
jgi:hypothetical protein